MAVVWAGELLFYLILEFFYALLDWIVSLWVAYTCVFSDDLFSLVFILFRGEVVNGGFGLVLDGSQVFSSVSIVAVLCVFSTHKITWKVQHFVAAR